MPDNQAPKHVAPKQVADVLIIHNVQSGGKGASSAVLLVRPPYKNAATSAVPATGCGADSGLKIWQMPGGHVEPGETPETAAQREADEELGAGAVRVGRKITQVTENDGTVAHVFEGHLNFAKQPQADGIEIAEVEWFATSVAAEKMNPLSANLFRAAMEKVAEVKNDAL